VSFVFVKMFTRRPVARLSMMTTSWCCARCDVSLETEQEHRQGAVASARFEPMKPAPPVTM
jgi:hypothetical protein